MSQTLKQLSTNCLEYDEAIPLLFDEPYRPQLHYCAPRHWLSDPNGLVWHKGNFHLFYQHNPNGNDWGNMHWGHAVSSDLMNWRHCDVAINADPWGTGFAFSGCAVVDYKNRSGLGAEGTAPMVALYTGSTTKGIQTQCIAYSVDDGDTWTQYNGNPVIANPGTRDFRDPKVFWNADGDEWVMILAAGQKLDLYQSKNLLDWEKVSEFNCRVEDAEDVLECPDLFRLQSADGATHWVLIVSATNPTHPNHRTTRYFIGSFDGRHFEPYDHHHARWIDHGPDNYATITWDNVPVADGRRIAIGWMSNWRYAREAPTYPWRGHMTLPRELFLVEDDGDFQLASCPVVEIESLRKKTVRLHNSKVDDAVVTELFSELPVDLLDLELEFEWRGDTPSVFGLVFSNVAGEVARIVIDLGKTLLVVDRTQVGQGMSCYQGVQVFEAPLFVKDNCIDLRIVKDRASVEVFACNGRVVVSTNLFFNEPFESVSLFGGADVKVQGEVSILNSIWTDTVECKSHV